MYVCGVPNKKFVSLAYMPNEPKVQNVKKVSVSVSMFVCMHPFVLCLSVALCVCGAKYKISIFGMYIK